MFTPPQDSPKAATVVSAVTKGNSTEIKGDDVVVDLPLLGKTLVKHKVIDRKSGFVSEVAVDEAGVAVDAEALFAEEEQRKRRFLGALSPSLHFKLMGTAQGEKLPVVITYQSEVPTHLMMKSDSSPGKAVRSQGDIEQAQRLRSAAIDHVFAQDGMDLTRALKALDSSAARVPGAPMITAVLTAKQIKDLGHANSVAKLDLDAQVSPELYVARRADYADIVNLNHGNFAAGIKIAVLETHARVNVDHVDLPGNLITQGDATACFGSLPPQTYHATAVAGVIMSTNAPDSGLANQASLYVGGGCGSTFSQLATAATDARIWGATAFNASYGIDNSRNVHAHDGFWDGMAYHHWRTVVSSAGNFGDGAGCTSSNKSEHISSPGAGYNILSVASYDDKGTYGNFGDDTWHPCSSWKAPLSTNGDRVKPEVLAPGVNITTVSHEVGFSQIATGTSFAAPQVTATAALLMKEDSDLLEWPELVRAAILASTRAVNGASAPPRFHDQEGNGRLDSLRARSVFKGTPYPGGWWGTDVNCSVTHQSPKFWGVSLNGGKRTRIVLSWATNPDYSSYITRPSADLDLIVKLGNDVLSASQSFDNTYEIIDFVPPSTATYQVGVYSHRCSGSPSSYYIGLTYVQDP